jgi:hypothetical protein
MRFSLSDSLIFVAVAALGFAAFFHASTGWGSALLTVTLTILSLASLHVIHGCGHRRPFWIGMALAGWGYLLLAFGPGFRESLGPLLPSSVLAEYAYPRIKVLVPADSVDAPDGTPVADINAGITYFDFPFRPAFERIVHLLGALAASWLGGLASRWVHHWNRGRRISDDQPASLRAEADTASTEAPLARAAGARHADSAGTGRASP